jgi:hypothetical protein
MVRATSEISDEAPEVQYTEDLFVYAVDFPLLAANGSVDANIQIEADSYFKWIKGTYFAYVDGTDPESTSATRPIPPVTIQITDSGSGRQLFNIPIFVSTIFGVGELPMINPLPRIFKPRSNISFSAQNLSAADDWRISLQLIGVKGFKGRG